MKMSDFRDQIKDSGNFFQRGGKQPKNVVLSLMQMLRKWQHLHLGTEPRTEHCDITDAVVKKMTTSAFGNGDQHC